jgi:diguanylate cyclase (GGDEF)-like protein
MGTDSAHLALLLYSEVNIISVVMMLVIAHNALRLRDNITDRTMLFAGSVLCAVFSNVCDFVWNLGLTDYISLSLGASWAVNSLYFLSLGACTYCWLLYAQTVFGGEMPPRRFRALAAIPLCMLGVLLVASLFTGCAFYFDSNGIYHRGPLFYLQHMLAYCYIVLTSVLCLVRALRSSNYDRRDELIAMSAFVCPPLVSILLQTYFQSIPILAVGIMVSFLEVFISIQRNMIAIDELTGIPNRREMLRHLGTEVRSPLAKGRLYFLFLDIDRFKRTNDEYGHAEGNRALRVLALVLRRIAAEENGFCARYGGDEFALALKCEGEEKVASVCHRIETDAKFESANAGLKIPISVSIGIAEYTPDMGGIGQLISAADAEMYKIKAERHEREV